MKKSLVALSFLLVSTTHCSLYGQWVKVVCPLAPKALAQKDGYLFTCGDGGIVRSPDAGLHREFINSGFRGSLNPDSSFLFYAYGASIFSSADHGDGVFRSSDDGAHWGPAEELAYTSIAFTSDDRYLFMSSNFIGDEIRRSLDSGRTWLAICSNFRYIDNRSASALAAGHVRVYGGNMFGDIYSTEDEGNHWKVVFKDSSREQISAIFASGENIIASFGSKFILSRDSETTWNTTDSGFSALAFYQEGSTIFAAGYFGIRYSLHCGRSWKSGSDGLGDSTVCRGVTVCSGYVFTGTNQSLDGTVGIWRRPLSDLTNGVGRNIGEAAHFTIWPNPSIGIVKTQTANPYIPIRLCDILDRDIAHGVTNSEGKLVLDVS